MNLGKVIKKLRKEQGMSQDDLCAQIGLSQTSISLIEKNRVMPEHSNLIKIAKALKTSVPVLNLLALEETDVPKSKRILFNEMMPSVMNIVKNITCE